MEPTKYTIISPAPLTLYATPLVTSFAPGAEILVSDLQTIEATNTVWAHVQLTETPLEGDGWIVAKINGIDMLRLTTPPPPETMWTTTIANLRSGPGTGNTIVKVLSAGVRLSVSGHYAGTGAPDWALVQEPVGYIARTLLTATEPTTPPPVIDPVETMQVASDIGLKIRAQPTVASSQIGSLANGAIVKVRGSTLAGDYHWAALVDYPIAGWVAREFLRPT